MFHFPHYPAFNIADSSIVVGLVAIFGFLLLNERRKPETTPDGD
jgi:lipoprotein signal peptidase